jgi:hypothetical protein
VALGAVNRDVERLVDALGAAVDWVDEAYEEARQTLIDGAVAGAVLLTSLALLPYVDGGGLIVALAFIGVVQAADLLGRSARGLLALMRRTLPSRALRE